MRTFDISTLLTDIPKPLCEHNEPLKYSRKYKAECPVCQSFWDLNALKSSIVYDCNYPEMRSHFNPIKGKNKVKTLQGWLRETHIELSASIVCEVGFGGGFCLQYLQKLSKQAFGVEAIPQNIEHAVSLGIKRENLYLADEVPSLLPSRVDYWFFQDSFEHIPDPSTFMRWLLCNSSDSSKILLVAPNSTSISERVLGKFWLHRSADHCFHWSRKGLVDFFLKRGFVLECLFNTKKYISVKGVIAHATLLSNYPPVFRNLMRLTFPNIVIRFNFGEMGLLLGKRSNSGS